MLLLLLALVALTKRSGRVLRAKWQYYKVLLVLLLLVMYRFLLLLLQISRLDYSLLGVAYLLALTLFPLASQSSIMSSAWRRLRHLHSLKAQAFNGVDSDEQTDAAAASDSSPL